MFFGRTEQIDRNRDDSRGRTRSRRTVPEMQSLEGRKLLAAAVFNPSTGRLVINVAEIAGNRVAVAASGGFVTINGGNVGIVASAPDQFRPLFPTQGVRLQASAISSIRVVGSASSDVIDLSQVGRAFNRLAGKPTATQLAGNAGDDIIIGSQFNDAINGGDGSDTLDGGAGDDRLDGGADGRQDSLKGGAGADVFFEDQSAPNPGQPIDRPDRPKDLDEQFIGNRRVGRDRALDYRPQEGDAIRSERPRDEDGLENAIDEKENENPFHGPFGIY